MTEEPILAVHSRQRNARLRERDRHLLLYLQRLAGKNDSFSEFGPTSWGVVDSNTTGARFSPATGITKRETFLERWTAHAIAAAMNADPQIFQELIPRRNPVGRRVDANFIFPDTGEVVPLDETDLDVFDRCDGRAAVHSFNEQESLVRLVAKKVLRCEVEVPALEPHAFSILRDDVLAWRAGEARGRWLAVLESIAALATRFAATVPTKERLQILEEAGTRFRELGIEPKLGGRNLYAARNPIGEECFRRSDFRIGKTLINEVAVQAEPWIDLWRDCYAFVASRVAAGLRNILAGISKENAPVPLPAFLRACENARLPLNGPGLVVLAHLAFEEVKVAFRAMMEPHRHKSEYELTTEDCHFIRRTFEFPKFDEYTYPSADLQLSGESFEAVGRGDYQWILAELHPPVALLHHGAYWSCPDKELLDHSLSQMVDNKPNLHFGFFAADFTAHTAVRIFDALPDFCNFVAPQRSNPAWRATPPGDAEVFVDEVTGDVCVRRIDTQELLGSFARGWLIPLGFHPFQFGMEPHMPRLRCGRVVVQRRAWVVDLEEFGPGDYKGISRDLVLAVEGLRVARDLPRYVYVRPTEKALRRSGVEGRDKDTKPIFVDFESYLCLEMFHHWLVKAGELEVTEMLPDPEHLCWQEADGRRTFELRTLIVPRS